MSSQENCQNINLQELLKIIVGLKNNSDKKHTHQNVLICGIHGSGKTKLCDHLKSKIPDLNIYSASKLINWRSQEKNVENIFNNQCKLIKVIERIKKEQLFFILEGHLCLWTTDNKIEFVGEEIIKILSPEAIFLLVENPNIVKKRLNQRDKREYLIEHIVNLQEKENYYAIENGLNLGIPVYRVIMNS